MRKKTEKKIVLSSFFEKLHNQTTRMATYRRSFTTSTANKGSTSATTRPPPTFSRPSESLASIADSIGEDQKVHTSALVCVGATKKVESTLLSFIKTLVF